MAQIMQQSGFQLRCGDASAGLRMSCILQSGGFVDMPNAPACGRSMVMTIFLTPSVFCGWRLFLKIHQCNNDILGACFRFSLYDVLNLGTLRIRDAGCIYDDINFSVCDADYRIGKAFCHQ